MIKGYLAQLRLLSRDVRLFLVTSALMGFVVWGAIYSVLLNLYLLRLGYGARFIGLINSAGLLSRVFSLPVGIISERAGMRRMLIASMVLSAIGFVALPFAEFASAGLRSSLLLATYFVGNLGIAVWAVNANPFLTAATGQQERSYAFSLSFVLGALGAFAGSLVAGYLPEAYAALLGSSLEEATPYRYTLLSAGAVMFAGVPPLVATGPTVIRSRQQVAEDKGGVPLALIAVMSLIAVLSVFGEGAARTFFNVYMDRGLAIATSRIGTLAALAQLLAMPATMATPIVADRIGKGKTILLGYVARALCLLPLALLPHWLAAGGGFIGVMAFAGFSRPASIAFHQESVRPRWRAAMSGATTMAAGLGFAAAAYGGGYLVPAVGYRSLFLVGAAISLVGALIFWARFVASRQRLIEEACHKLAP